MRYNGGKAIDGRRPLGTVATYRCYIHYILEGSPTRTCVGEEQWSTLVPQTCGNDKTSQLECWLNVFNKFTVKSDKKVLKQKRIKSMK